MKKRLFLFVMVSLLTIGRGDLTMANANYLNENDSLASGYPKINAAIGQAEQSNVNSDNAIDTANSAVSVANQALSNSLSTQGQLNQIVIEGDSSVEAAQARVNADGSITYDTLKERLDRENQEVNSQLAEIPNQIASKVDKVAGKGLSTNDYTNTDKMEVGKVVSKADKSYVDTITSSIASGSPKATYATLSALQTALPTGDTNIYLVTADGNWYYWNGTDWTSGGIYQSTGIADGSVTSGKTDFIQLSSNLFDKSTIKAGTYISLTGEEVGDVNFALSDFIPIKQNTNYIFKHKAVPGAFYKNDKSFLSSFNGVVTVTSPADAYYMRITIPNANINTQQVNEGNTLLPYEDYYKKLKPFIQVDGDSLSNESIGIEKTNFNIEIGAINLFDKNATDNIIGKYIDANGVIATNSSYTLSKFIAVKSDTYYLTNASTNTLDVSGYYDENQIYLGRGTLYNFTTPSNCKYVRINCLNVEKETFMFYEYKGEVLDYIPYESNYLLNDKIKVDYVNIVNVPKADEYKRIYSLSDCINEWKSGEKFPIAFFGDSTTAGAGTSEYTANNVVGTDYILSTSYPYLLENMLKDYTENASLRIYNAGFSGQTTSFAVQSINNVFTMNPSYSDVKMIGIVFGINDRSIEIDTFKSNLERIISWCYENNIQPFIVTPQTVVQGYADLENVQTSLQLSSVISRILKDMSQKYNLELIDLNKYTSDFVDYSKLPLDTIIPDTLHFGDEGNQYMAELIFSHIIGNTLFAEKDLDIKVTNPLVKRSYLRSEVFTDAGTKERYVEYTNTSTDKLINEAYVFNCSNHDLGLKLNLSAISNFYVKINGELQAITDLNNVIATLPLGLHKIELYSGTGSTGKYKGMELVLQ